MRKESVTAKKVEEKKRSRKRMHACGEGDGESRMPAKTFIVKHFHQDLTTPTGSREDATLG